MKRLTIRNGDGTVSQPTNLDWAAALNKLADYEDVNIDPQKIKTRVISSWDATGRYSFPDGCIAIRCDICGACLYEEEYKRFKWNYCPNCGVEMTNG